MASRRILITGLSTHWGGRLAKAMEADPDVEAIIGIATRPPKFELDRTEFVQVADSHSLIRRIVQAAEIDTVVDTRLVVDSITTSARKAHENNVIGTMNILAACGGADSTVKKIVFKSSAHWFGCEQDDPSFFTEAMRRPHPPRTPIERDIVEAEQSVADFARANPDTVVTVLRLANGLGPDLRTSHTAYLAPPVVPTILGFDPRYQFIHEDDMANALEHAVRHELPGIYNVAGDGVLALSEVLSLLGKVNAPVLPPWGTGLALSAAGRAGVRIPAEMHNQLRFGRGLDNRKLKAAGFRFRYTTREAVLKLREHQRLHPLLARGGPSYRYEREVEEFLRRSPSVKRTARRPDGPANLAPGERRGARPQRRVGDAEELPAAELIALLPSMPAAELEALRAHEQAGDARGEVLSAIDAVLVRTSAG